MLVGPPGLIICMTVRDADRIYACPESPGIKTRMHNEYFELHITKNLTYYSYCNTRNVRNMFAFGAGCHRCDPEWQQNIPRI